MASIIAQWQREKPDLGPGPMALFGALARAYLLTSPVIESLMAKHGLARGMFFDVLAALRRACDAYRLPPSQLPKSPSSGMTNRFDRLKALRLIVLLPEPSDRGSVQIQLIPKSLQLVEATILGLPVVQRGFRDPMLARQIGCLRTRLVQHRNGLLFRKPDPFHRLLEEIFGAGHSAYDDV